MKGGLGCEPFALQQFGHSRHAGFKRDGNILCAYRLDEKLKRSRLENGGGLGGVLCGQLHIRLPLPVGLRLLFVATLALTAVARSRISPAGLIHKVGLHAIADVLKVLIIDAAMLVFDVSFAP